MTGWLRVYWSKVVSGLAITAVAGVTGVVSYTHIYRLTLALHQTVMVARLMPFGVDGLIVVGSVVLMQSAGGQRWLGWVGVGPGVAISLLPTWSPASDTAGWQPPGPVSRPSRSAWPRSCWNAGSRRRRASQRALTHSRRLPRPTPRVRHWPRCGPRSRPGTRCRGGSSKRGLASPARRRPECASWLAATGTPAERGEAAPPPVAWTPASGHAGCATQTSRAAGGSENAPVTVTGGGGVLRWVSGPERGG